MTAPEADQQAAAARERDRVAHQATLNGETATIRTITVITDPAELEALEGGEHIPGIQAQIDRQVAEDAAIEAMETGL